MRASPRDLRPADIAWSGDLRCHRGGSAGRAHERSSLSRFGLRAAITRPEAATARPGAALTRLGTV